MNNVMEQEVDTFQWAQSTPTVEEKGSILVLKTEDKEEPIRRVETVANRIDDNKEKRRKRSGKPKITYLDNNKEHMLYDYYLAFCLSHRELSD